MSGAQEEWEESMCLSLNQYFSLKHDSQFRLLNIYITSELVHVCRRALHPLDDSFGISVTNFDSLFR